MTEDTELDFEIAELPRADWINLPKNGAPNCATLPCRRNVAKLAAPDEGPYKLSHQS